MNINEWLLLIGIMVPVFAISGFIGKNLKPKTRLILSLAWFILCVTFFIASKMANHFTTLQLWVAGIFAAARLAIFYLQFKKYKTVVNNY